MNNHNPDPEALEAAAKTAYETYGKGQYGAPWEQLHPRVRAEYCEQLSPMISTYLAAAEQTVSSTAELEALPQETVIRSLKFGVVRERLDSGWLASSSEEFEQSKDIANREHLVIYRPGE